MTAQSFSQYDKVLQQISQMLDSGDSAALRTLLAEYHPSDIADLLEILENEQRVDIFNLLQPIVAADVLDETRAEVTRTLVDAVPDEQIADLLEALPVNDAVDVLDDLSDSHAAHILTLMEPQPAAEVEELLRYPEGTAGRLMTTGIVRLQSTWTVSHTFDYLRTIDKDVEILTYLYVVGDQGELLGVLPLRQLITGKPDTVVKDLMNISVVSVMVDADQELAAHIVAQYDYFAIPVIDHESRLVGIITHDDIVDILKDEATEDIQRMGGSQPLEDSYLATPVLTVARKRVGWLLVLFFTEMLTGTVMRSFEGILQQVVALAFFVPLMIGTGGNSGSQTTSTIVRALAVGDARFQDLWKLVWHELRIGLVLGVIMGIAGYLRALTWRASAQLAITVSVSLFAIVVWSNLFGALLPPIATRLRIDPAIISGPVMSTLVDATGLLFYFTLAHFIMGL